MNRRNLISLGIASALARFFPIPKVSEPPAPQRKWPEIVSLVMEPARCPFTFMDHACGYDGAKTSCDKTAQACVSMDNLARFGGYLGPRSS